ncbi:MAG: bacillithiol system redox-active protein YtxJ [Urechidicola sp.]|nr:bacillithiol system redox-active protein YtxJ [Urechidicola sp.]
MLKKIFGSKVSEEEKIIDWIPLTDMHQLEEITASEKPVIIFKHSTRCGISTMVLKKFERNFTIDNNHLKMYFLDLIAYRSISNKIASDYGVRHESPQLLLVKKGKAIVHNSHSGIHTIALEDFL